MTRKYLIYFLLIILVAILLIKKTFSEGFEINKEPLNTISDVWYINLDRSPDRKEKVLDEIKKLGNIPNYRWKAVDGSTLTDKDYLLHSIPAWSRPSFAKNDKARKGEIGCFLSHKTLLQHLNTVESPSTNGHLILEDDIVLDNNVNSIWNKAIKTLDPNWDMIFLGLLGNKINNVKDGIGKPEWITGTHAYIVKHESIPKILKSLDILYDPIDEMYGRNQYNLKIFAFSPSIANQAGGDSTMLR